MMLSDKLRNHCCDCVNAKNAMEINAVGAEWRKAHGDWIVEQGVLHRHGAYGMPPRSPGAGRVWISGA